MKGTRRQALRRLGAWPGMAAAVLAVPQAAPARAAAYRPWPAWEQFVRHFIGSGGRVVEHADPRQRTVSEAQGYALFFALVANQPELFERLLRWTEDNLAGGDLTRRLPAWHWGRRDDGSWGVIDSNAAADADLWIAHALAEAGRLWGQRRYTALAVRLAERVLAEECADLPGLGLTLLPGPKGFAVAPGRWRVNPSYLVPLQLRWFASHLGAPWQALHDSALKVLLGCSPRGLAPDWTTYDGTTRQFLHEQPAGSYDAIRVYLWLGLDAGAATDARLAKLQAHFAPMAAATDLRGAPPERVDVLTGPLPGDGPPGFSAALLPWLQAQGRTTALQRQQQRLHQSPAAPDAYYDQVLRLFGEGALEGRFAFDVDGGLQAAWHACRPQTPATGRARL
jgi:endo-1,4-beta-D-glucanase Y